MSLELNVAAIKKLQLCLKSTSDVVLLPLDSGNGGQHDPIEWHAPAMWNSASCRCADSRRLVCARVFCAPLCMKYKIGYVTFRTNETNEKETELQVSLHSESKGVPAPLNSRWRHPPVTLRSLKDGYTALSNVIEHIYTNYYKSSE